MARPERFVVGHPFNPVYLLPLVELCGGERDRARDARRAPPRSTARSACSRSSSAARSTASSPTACSRRSGARRSGSSHDGVATVEEIDDAIRFGAGLRWASMGTFLTYRIAGGEAGHAALHGAVRARAAAAVDEADGRARSSTDELLDKHRRAVRRAGRRALDPRARAPARRLPRLAAPGPARRTTSAPARCSRATSARCSRAAPAAATARDRRGRCGCTRRSCAPDWIDYNGHAHESRYLQVFGDTTDALLRARHRRRLLDARRQLLHGRVAPLAPRPGARRRAAARRRRRSSATTTSACTSSMRCTAATTTR